MPAASTASAAWPPPHQVRISTRTRRILVSIHNSRGLEIVSPKALSARFVLDLLNQHRPWIEVKLQAYQQGIASRQEATWPKHQLPSVIHFPALNQHWQLSHIPCLSSRTRLHMNHEQQQLTLQGESELGWGVLQRWFIAQTKAQLLPMLHQLADAHGDPLQGSGARWNHSRWGSCSRAGRINLSARLLWLEPAEVNYVLHHELNHLHHFDHSPAFWQSLEARLPGALSLDRGIRHAHKRASFPAWLKLV
ncbi:MAG: DUF45 domain-containing protein [Halothiobacillaceae bacterium]|nr:DUF45 domain-containing protein [Halothiobacillaceae bacterium]